MTGIKFVAFLVAALVWSQTAASQQTPSPADKTTVVTSPAADRAIADRISGIYRHIEELGNVRVDVGAGVVTLRGEVVDDSDRDKAADVARRIEGVVDVQNEIEVARDIGTRGGAIYDRLSERFDSFVAGIPLFLIALFIFLLFLWFSGWLGRHDRYLDRLSANALVRQLLSQTIRGAVIVLGLVLALEILDATSLVGAVLGAAGLTGLVLGFAMKETVENYVAGLLMSLRQPFAPYDHIEVAGNEGRVIRLTARATIILTMDGNHVRIPNAEVFKSTLTNYTRNPERRFQFQVGVGVQTDLVEARNLAIESMVAMPAILEKPEPDAWVETLGDSNVVLTLVGWMDQTKHNFAKVRGDAIRRVKIAFEAAEYDLPEPIYRLNLMGHDIPMGGTVTETESAAPQAAAPEKDTPPPEPDEVDLDLERDTFLESEVARERAEMEDTDLLDPSAKKE